MGIYLDVMKPGDAVTLTPKAQRMPVVQDELHTGGGSCPHGWKKTEASGA
jgi:hypothetical protein